MSSLAFLQTLRSYGIELTADREQLRYRAPKGVMTPALLTQIQAHKAELLALLREPAANTTDRVGRHGDPCPQCGETWQWPTAAGTWVCAWCFIRPSARQIVTKSALT